MQYIWLYGCMKTTMNIPDELYRRVKGKSALEGRAVRDVTVALYTCWLGDAAETAPRATAEQWLNDWVRKGADVRACLPKDGPTATELLAADRDRLTRR